MKPPDNRNESLIPTVSVFLAVRNEEDFIGKALASLLGQASTNFKLEILVIDGLSTDRTLEKVEEVAGGDDRVRVIRNPNREIPFAWNLGLQAASGDYICTFGGHCIYDTNYIATCLKELVSQKAVGCGGRVLSVSGKESLQARLSSWVLGHPFGTSTRSFRTQPEGFVDSPAYPVFLKSAVVNVGGYDEDLYRNEDNDISYKLRAAGGKLYCTWKTRCYYFGKDTLVGLFVYAFRNGLWNALGLRKNTRMMSVRHFIPFIFVLFFLLFSCASLAPVSWGAQARIVLLGVLGIHLAIGFLAGAQTAIKSGCWSALTLPFLFLGFHIAYGVGTLCGVVKLMKSVAGISSDMKREHTA